MDGQQLLSRALEALKGHWATRTVAERLEASGGDDPLGARLLAILFAKCERDIGEFDRAVADFIAFSEEFVRLQMELDRTGRYRFERYDDARRAVYDNPEVMTRRYLNGLFLSTVFWNNHTRMFRYFTADFCAAGERGRVLEVPSGTGIFVSEFARRNPGWSAAGVDISDSAVTFGTAVARLNGAPQVAICKGDVFALAEDRSYDRVICGELLEHLEHPEDLLRKLAALVAPGGKLFVTTAIWAASIDHIYLFRSVREARELIERSFVIESELALGVLEARDPEEERVPVNYACVLSLRASGRAAPQAPSPEPIR